MATKASSSDSRVKVEELPGGSRKISLSSRLSRQLPGGESWEALLRRGIRGGSPGEILGILNSETDSAGLLEPSRLGVRDRMDLWFALSSGSRWPAIKSAIRFSLKLLQRLTGVVAVPDLSLAFRKR